MTSRERVRRAIHFEGVDRIPIMHAVLPGAWMKHGQALHEILSRYPRDLAGEAAVPGAWHAASCGYQQSGDLARFVLVDDFAYVEPRHFMYGPANAAGSQRDEWGCLWIKLDPGVVGQVTGHPLADWEAVKHFRWPDPLAYWRWDDDGFTETIARARRSGKYVIAYGGNLFEKMQWLRGYEGLLIDIMQYPERAQLLIEKVTRFNVATIEAWSRYGVDAVLLSDDWGTQQQLMIPPRLWRELFKPAYRAHCDAIRAAGCDIHLHTDGNTSEIIPDFIELGVDVLNPQLSAMDMDGLARLTRDRVCIRTDVDRQYILAGAPPAEVDAYVQSIVTTLGSSRGGLIGYGELNSDCRLDSVEAMCNAFEKYGSYVNAKGE